MHDPSSHGRSYFSCTFTTSRSELSTPYGDRTVRIKISEQFTTVPSMEFPTQEPLSLQILVLISLPVPHVTEHVDQSDHSSQSLLFDLEPLVAPWLLTYFKRKLISSSDLSIFRVIKSRLDLIKFCCFSIVNTVRLRFISSSWSSLWP